MAKAKQRFDVISFIIGALIGALVVAFFNVRPHIQEATQQAGAVAQKKVVTAQAPAKEKSNLTTPPTKKNNESVGRIAIIIDDWGYTKRNCHFLKEIKEPIAIAILPNLLHSTTIATCAQNNNKQIMLHLPLEPFDLKDVYPKDYLIDTAMSEDTIRQILSTTLNRMPWVQGVNNHMGSKATSDERVMNIVLDEMKKRKLFFIDSLVVNTSVVDDVATRKAVPFAIRDIFLDNLNRRAAIEDEFNKLAQIAKRKGYAIAIGHDRPLTMEIVKEQIAVLKKKGFDIVPVQELLFYP